MNDTIAAVSSPCNDHRVIIRLSGSQSLEIINQIFIPAVNETGITSGKISNLNANIYFFHQPHSYTGDDLAEIHIWANQAITETIMEQLISLGARPASPGEFTARAYLNNKIDLAQAEAVNEIITASNTIQLSAAENLLAGQFGHTLEHISSTILDVLSRLEADLDFSEDIDCHSERSEESHSLTQVINQLQYLLANSIHCESTIDLPSVGIAGAPNAGKSTLLNKLLGRQRSIVSHKRKTTRDVLTGEFELPGCRCVLFDCAGLIMKTENILDELAQQAAIEALKNAMVIIFCVDITKQDWTEDIEICQFTNKVQLIPVATKIDSTSEKDASARIQKLNYLFGMDFLPISAQTGFGIDNLKTEISKRIISTTSGHNKEGIALTSRHRQAITSSIADLTQAIKELKQGNDEVAAMMLRTAHSQLGNIEQHAIDEQILDRIFSRFCIGK